jgi:hypothetical protein
MTTNYYSFPIPIAQSKVPLNFTEMQFGSQKHMLMHAEKKSCMSIITKNLKTCICSRQLIMRYLLWRKQNTVTCAKTIN